MVSDSLTYVYSSHEWQQARATTSFGLDYRTLLVGCKALAITGTQLQPAHTLLQLTPDSLLRG